MVNRRNEAIESPLAQSLGETLAYTVTTTPWGGGPAGPVVSIFEAGTNVDVTAALFPVNNPTVLGDLITTGDLIASSMVVDLTYRLVIGWHDADGHHWEVMCRILCPY